MEHVIGAVVGILFIAGVLYMGWRLYKSRVDGANGPGRPGKPGTRPPV